MKQNNKEPQVTPLQIHNPGDKDGEYFNLDSVYMLTLESFSEQDQVLQHAMAAPGFYLPRTGVVAQEYTPGIRPLHRHAQIELMYIMNGVITQYIEDDCRVYHEGECCILNKNVRHVEAYSSDFEAVFLMLSDDFLHRVIEQDVVFQNFREYSSNPSPLYQELIRMQGETSAFQKEYIDFTPVGNAHELSEKAESLLMEILQETICQESGFLSIVLGLISRFLALLSDSGCYRMNKISMHSTREDYLFNRVMLYLRKNTGRINYDELETLMYYSRDYLNRIVKKRSGKTLGELAKEICLEKAATQLKETDKSVSEIIHTLGYTNRSYFYRIFQEKYGITPAEYKKK